MAVAKRFLERILFLSPLVIATRETFPRDFIISTKVLPKFYGAGGREQRETRFYPFQLQLTFVSVTGSNSNITLLIFLGECFN